MHTETDEEVRFANRQKEAEQQARPYVLPPKPFIRWRPPGFSDPRGTYEQREAARVQLNEFDRAMQRQDPGFRKHKDEIIALVRGAGLLRNTPFTEWVKVVQAQWVRVLARDNGSHSFHSSGVQYQNLPKLAGLRAESVIIDDPINQETTVKGKKVRVPKAPKKDYNTVGVRFLRGHNLHKVYTYKVAKKVKLGLGEEIVVPTGFEGLETNSIAVVVEVHPTPRDDCGGIYYKFVTGKISRV